MNSGMKQQQLEQCNVRVVSLERQVQELRSKLDAEGGCEMRMQMQRSQLEELQRQVIELQRKTMEYIHSGRGALDYITKPLTQMYGGGGANQTAKTSVVQDARVAIQQQQAPAPTSSSVMMVPSQRDLQPLST